MAQQYKKVIGDTFKQCQQSGGSDNDVCDSGGGGTGGYDDHYVEEEIGGGDPVSSTKRDQLSPGETGQTSSAKKRAISAKSHIFRKGKIADSK